MKPTAELPDDPALPAIAIIRKTGLARALPMLLLGDQPVDLHLCGYTPGERATFEARVADRRLAVKVYADDPAPEAELYQAFAAAGFAGEAGPRAPRLLAWERDLRVLVISWLAGEPANDLIKDGQGRRAGELAAVLLWRLASLPIKLGPSFGPGDLLYQVGRSVAELGAADAAVGDGAARVAKVLKRTQPKNGYPRLVHGTLYARHILNLGDGGGGGPGVPGVIDWQRYGQGPVEVDAGMFLATVTRLGLRHPGTARDAAEAEHAFLEATRGLVDGRTLAWYRAASLVQLASRGLRRQAPSEAGALVAQAARLAEQTSTPAPTPTLAVTGSALELVLAALSATPTTRAELDQIQALLDEKRRQGS